ncbi:Fic family protein [Fervidobacterium sp.]
MCHKKLFKGIIKNPERFRNLRQRPIRILGSRIKTSEYGITDCVARWSRYVECVYERLRVHEVTARSHVLFESIHPFEDGNSTVEF